MQPVLPNKFPRGAIVALAIYAILSACATSPIASAPATSSDQAITYVSPEAVRRMQQQGPVMLVDTGSLSGTQGRIAGAVNINDINVSQFRLSTGATVVVYHSSFSNQAARDAAAKLRSTGANVAVMDGGLLAWIRAGYPIAQPGLPASAPTAINTVELKRAIRDEEKFLLIDLRDSSEFLISHIDGARHIDPSRIAAESATWSKDRWIVFYDRDNGHAQVLADALRRQGFSYTGYLAGGYDGWLKASAVVSN